MQLAALVMTQGDKNGDMKLTRQEMASLADNWFDKVDTDKTGKVNAGRFRRTLRRVGESGSRRLAVDLAVSMQGGGSGGGRGGCRRWTVGAGPVLDWPEFNKLIGGFFKFHWVYPQVITIKIDDPKSPLTAMFHGEEFDIHDETYTFAQDSFSRKNVHMLTSIDYDKMSAADKAKEQHPADGQTAITR